MKLTSDSMTVIASPGFPYGSALRITRFARIASTVIAISKISSAMCVDVIPNR